MARMCIFYRYHHFTNKIFTTFNQTNTRNVVTFRICRAGNNFPAKGDNYIYTSQFKSTQDYSSASSLNTENVFKSTVSDIQNYRGVFVHEHVWKNADKWWNKTALVCSMTGRSYTYEQLRKLCGRFATSLRKNNLRPGDTIAAILPNVPEYAILLMGASEAGIKVTLVNPMYTAEEIKRQLVDSDAVAVVTIPSRYSVIAESIVDNSAIRLPVIVIDKYGSLPSGSIIFKDLISDNIEEFKNTGKKTKQDPENDTFIIPYSSGTTGLPKGVELTHRNIVANIYQNSSKEITVDQEAIGDHQEIVLGILPIYHVYGFMLLGFHLSIGGKIICVPQFSSNGFLELLEKNKVSTLYVAPPMIQLVANDPRFAPRHMEHIKLITSGAAPMSLEVIEKFYQRCGRINFIQAYGLSETSPAITRSKKSPLESSGILVANTEVRIVAHEGKNEGRNLGPKEIGEIYVRGPQVMKGYYKNPQATQNSMENDWFKTGDLGYMDDQGFLYLKGRLKELIKVQGYQVAPSELEDIIQGHEKVADAAVIGVPHERYGEIPKAFIVPKPNTQINEQDIKDFVAKRVSKHKQLGHVVVIDKIPKSGAGKILRQELQKI